MAQVEKSRWDTALKRVARIERKSESLKSRLLPRKFSFHRRSAWATPAGAAMLPDDQRYEEEVPSSTRARVRAEAVLIGKFDVQSEVRLRAFYPATNSTIRYQAGGPNNGIIRTVTAYNHVKDYAPDLMPAVYEHGSILDGQGAYLIEEMVLGETATRRQLEDIIVPLTSQLHAVHQGIGITSKSASEALGSRHLARWKEFTELRGLDKDLVRAVDKLHTRNALLEVSLTHGDLVNSNILVTGDKFVLVDWEWFSIKPIAFDMGKMISNVSDIDKALAHMQEGLGSHIGTKNDFYNFREQVALALVQTLTFYKRQLVKARKAKRTGALERQTVKRLDALEKLMELA